MTYSIKNLETLCRIVDSDLNISDASLLAHKTQSTLSRQIHEIERSLGINIFERRRNKLLRLTKEGEQIVDIARRLLREQQNLRMVGEDARQGDSGNLAVATTHTQARYMLPPVVRAFMDSYPKVNLTLRQGDPVQCHGMVVKGVANLAVCTEVPEIPDGVVFVPCYRLNRSIITPKGHPLTRLEALTLESISQYPLITYGEAFSGRHVVNDAFSRMGLTPKVVLSAVDADVSKAYVEFGLGIAILATIAFDPSRDTRLAQLNAHKIFASSALGVVVPRAGHLRKYVTDFIVGFAPHITVRSLRRFVSGGDASALAQPVEL